MAFSINAIASLTDVPALVDSFAAVAGWTTGGSGTTRTFIRPGGGETFQMEYGTGSDLLEYLRISIPGLSAVYDQLNNVRINGTQTNPDTPSPTRLFLFSGTEEGEAFIAGAIEFGNNRFRHFYIGNMVKKGNYTGGEVFSCVQAYQSRNSFDYGSNQLVDNSYLFNALSKFSSTTDGGFVNIVHVDSPVQVAPFYAPNAGTDYTTNWPAGYAHGGPTDRVSDEIAQRGHVQFAAASLLVPMNLFLTVTANPARFRPLGHPAGARSVSIKNLEPTAQVSVGGVDWRVFPLVKKSADYYVNYGTGYGEDELSQYFGVAWPENLAT